MMSDRISGSGRYSTDEEYQRRQRQFTLSSEKETTGGALLRASAIRSRHGNNGDGNKESWRSGDGTGSTTTTPTTTPNCDNHSLINQMVYIKDDAFAWLPARVVSVSSYSSTTDNDAILKKKEDIRQSRPEDLSSTYPKVHDRRRAYRNKHSNIHQRSSNNNKNDLDQHSHSISASSSMDDNSSIMSSSSTASSSIAAGAGTTDQQAEPCEVTVRIVLPPDWNDCTIISPFSNDNKSMKATQQMPKYLSNIEAVNDRLIGGSGARMVMERVINLDDYPNRHLPRMNFVLAATSSSPGRKDNYDTYGDDTGPVVPLHKADIADLPYLHEAAILYNVKHRHYAGMPYTRVNDIIVAMNPFEWIDGLYSEQKQALYAHKLIWNASEDNLDGRNNTHSIEYFTKGGIDPHVYETSAYAYRGLALDGQNQAILVSGESGAGKTETVKIVMNHLAMIQSMRECVVNDGDGSRAAGATDVLSSVLTADNGGVVTKVLESNSIFEAFGNARTARNDNSSRFGKFAQLQFIADGDVTSVLVGKEGQKSSVPHCALVGSNSETYLLEKSRVVGHDLGERTYHVFYQLLAAPEAHRREIWDGLLVSDKSYFKYVFHAETHQDESSEEDAANWHTTIGDLALFNLRGSVLKTLMRALCIIIQLGNLTFVNDRSNIERTLVDSIEELAKLSSLMGVNAEDIALALTTRKMTTRGENFYVFLNTAAAKDACDALAKEMYAKIFDVIVRAINEATHAKVESQHGKKRKKFLTICLLDLFGFESFEVNRFEQLCINYANEKLQQKYVVDNFRLVQDEYIAEGIDLFDLSLVDNKHILDLVEGRMGILMTLNDECVRPNGSDTSFVYKVKTLHRESKLLIQRKLDRPYEFGIQHFAGPVTYDARKFTERNNDALPADLIDCACRSTNSMIRTEFERARAPGSPRSCGGSLASRKSFSASNTVAAKFRSQLVRMMTKIEDTRTRYIRCIRPNKEKEPRLTDHRAAMTQLTSAGLVTAITISRETFPDRLSYDEVLDRFSCLTPESEDSYSNIKATVEQLLTTLFDGFVVELVGGLFRSPYACGKTRVYFRPGALERLESERMVYYGARALVVQRWLRMISASVKYQMLRKASIWLQAQLHARIVRSLFLRMRLAATAVQCFQRCGTARSQLRWLQVDRAAMLIQTRYRMRKPLASMGEWRKAAVVIQRWLRGKKSKSNFASLLAKCVEDARKDHQVKKLQRTLANVSRGEVPQELSVLTQKSGKMLEYYRSELFQAKRLNGELQAERDKLLKANTKLHEFQNTFNSAVTVSNRRIVQLGRSNQDLAKEVALEKHRSIVLFKQLKHEQVDHEEDLIDLRQHHEKEMESSDLENAKLRKKMESMQTLYHRKLHKVEKELMRTKKVHAAEVTFLKEELQTTQDVHNEYLTKLMDVLETAHASREVEAERLADEFEATLAEKEDEISRLRRELKSLKSVHSRTHSRLAI